MFLKMTSLPLTSEGVSTSASGLFPGKYTASGLLPGRSTADDVHPGDTTADASSPEGATGDVSHPGEANANALHPEAAADDALHAGRSGANDVHPGRSAADGMHPGTGTALAGAVRPTTFRSDAISFCLASGLLPGRSTADGVYPGEATGDVLYPGEATSDALHPGEATANALHAGRSAADDIRPGRSAANGVHPGTGTALLCAVTFSLARDWTEVALEVDGPLDKDLLTGTSCLPHWLCWYGLRTGVAGFELSGRWKGEPLTGCFCARGPWYGLNSLATRENQKEKKKCSHYLQSLCSLPKQLYSFIHA